MTYHIFEGPLPLTGFSSPMVARAPYVCVTRDALHFVSYSGVGLEQLAFLGKHEVRYPLNFHDNLHHAFELLNTRFRGPGFYRALLYKNLLFIEVIYAMDYSNDYVTPPFVPRPPTVCIYRPDVADWTILWHGRLTLERIHKYGSKP